MDVWDANIIRYNRITKAPADIFYQVESNVFHRVDLPLSNAPEGGVQQVLIQGEQDAFRVYTDTNQPPVITSSPGGALHTLTPSTVLDKTATIWIESLAPSTGLVAHVYSNYALGVPLCTGAVTIASARVIAEPINYFPWNPAGLPKGCQANYVIRLDPPDIYDDYITWKSINNKVFVYSPMTGTNTLVTAGQTTGLSGLTADIMGCQLPTLFNIQVFEPKTVNVVVWIVRDNFGNNAPLIAGEVANRIAEANGRLLYAAITLNLVAIVEVDNTAWQIVDYISGIPSQRMGEFNAVPNPSNGIKVFFVNTIGNNTTGLRSSNSIAISTSANQSTLAHEVGHACGLVDIYENLRNSQNVITASVTGHVESNRMNPLDWAAGYYPENLQQAELILRLLMYGKKNETKGYIPHGNVFGLNTSGADVSRKVGLDGMNRQPQHQPQQP